MAKQNEATNKKALINIVIPRTVTGKVSLGTNWALLALIAYSALVGDWQFAILYAAFYGIKKLRESMIRHWIRPLEEAQFRAAVARKRMDDAAARRV